MITSKKSQMGSHLQEEFGQGNNANDYRRAIANHSSSRGLLVMLSILGFLSIAAIVLNLLMFFGKVECKCGCIGGQLGKLAILLTLLLNLQYTISCMNEKRSTNCENTVFLEFAFYSYCVQKFKIFKRRSMNLCVWYCFHQFYTRTRTIKEINLL